MNILSTVGSLIETVVDKAIPDKGQAAELKSKLNTQLLQLDIKQLESATSVIVAEAQGESWLQRNWRPSLMLLFGVIIANNYIIYPYLSLFFENAPVLEIPPDMWALLKIGIGGYVVSRGGEKMVKEYRKG